MCEVHYEFLCTCIRGEKFCGKILCTQELYQFMLFRLGNSVISLVLFLNSAHLCIYNEVGVQYLVLKLVKEYECNVQQNHFRPEQSLHITDLCVCVCVCVCVTV